MQIKLRYHLSSIRPAKIPRFDNVFCWQACGEMHTLPLAGVRIGATSPGGSLMTPIDFVHLEVALSLLGTQPTLHLYLYRTLH